MIEGAPLSGTFQVSLEPATVRLADDSFATLLALSLDGQGTSPWRLGLSVDNQFRLSRSWTCTGGLNDPDCPMIAIRWQLDGGVIDGFGMLSDVMEDGRFTPFSTNLTNRDIGRRVEVPIRVDTSGSVKTLTIDRTPVYPDSEFTYGTYLFEASADFPLVSDVAPGEKWAHRWTRTSLKLGEPLPDVSRPTMPSMPPRPDGIQMFSGEQDDAFGVGFTPKAALDHLRNTSLEARATLEEGGCVVFYQSETPVREAQGPSTARIEIRLKTQDGSVNQYVFTSFGTVAGLPSVFGEASSQVLDQGIPLSSSCDSVLSSAASISSARFLERARAIELTTGGEFFFQWHASDLTGQKPLVPGVGHFLLAGYPPGWNAMRTGTFIPYRVVMDADTGWWEAWTIGREDLALLDQAP